MGINLMIQPNYLKKINFSSMRQLGLITGNPGIGSENRSVGGSIPPLGTNKINDLAPRRVKRCQTLSHAPRHEE